jgi:hypothetical protein
MFPPEVVNELVITPFNSVTATIGFTCIQIFLGNVTAKDEAKGFKGPAYSKGVPAVDVPVLTSKLLSFQSQANASSIAA